ncbi:MAG: PrgI family protein [Candidatus Kerfeldbacteria bacterium]|nr:PrgI family protein [Candidatus Kerfeldbacteria bacterium]
MPQFIVPQFIDVEDKIIGPISVRQFLTFLVGAALIFANYQIVYKVLYPNFWVFAISSIFIFAVAGTFAFLKINGRTFHYFLLNLFVTMQKPRLRVWNKRLRRSDFLTKEEAVEIAAPLPVKAPLTMRKLTELSLIVDTGGAYREELPEESTPPSTTTKPGTVTDIFADLA